MYRFGDIPDKAYWKAHLGLFQHAREVLCHAQRLRIASPKMAELTWDTATAACHKRAYREAEQLYQAALDATRRVHGSTHLDIATIQADMAFMYLDQDRHSDAVIHAKQAMAIIEALPDRPQSERAEFIRILALAYDRDAQDALAANAYDEALMLARDLAPDAEAIEIFTVCADWRWKNGRSQEAVRLAQAALDAARQCCGADSLTVARMLLNAARFSAPNDREKLCEQALEIADRNLEADDPGRAIYLQAMAANRIDHSRFEEAEFLFEQVIKIFENSWGGAHPLVVKTLFEAFRIWLRCREWKRAESCLTRATAKLESADDLIELACWLDKAAEVYLEVDDESLVDKALQLMARAAGLREKTQEFGHPDHCAAALDNVLRLVNLGRRSEAEKFFGTARAIIDPQKQIDSRIRGRLRLLHGQIWLSRAISDASTDREAELQSAEDWLRQAVEAFRQAPKRDYCKMGQARSLLAITLSLRGQSAACVAYCQESFRVLQPVLGESHEVICHLQNTLNDAQQDLQTNFSTQPGQIGRNQPCPCGSGRKYKRCHGRPSLGP